MNLKPSELWHRLHSQNPGGFAALLQMSALYNNLIEEVQMVLRPVKPPGREAR